MSAVICSDTTPSASLELKSAALTLMAMVLKTTDLDRLARELGERAAAVPGLFDDEPVVIDLAAVNSGDDDSALDVEALITLLCHHGLRPVAVRGGSEAQMAAACAAGLFEAPEGARPLREATPPPPPQVIERIVEVQLQPLPPLVIDKPLRSGQQVYARDRDLIVRALVSYGAEVKADGDIHCYAPMRGRAHAGAKGNTHARIYCHRLEAQVLIIAGVVRTSDEPLPEGAAMVRLAGERLEIEPLG